MSASAYYVKLFQDTLPGDQSWLLETMRDRLGELPKLCQPGVCYGMAQIAALFFLSTDSGVDIKIFDTILVDIYKHNQGISAKNRYGIKPRDFGVKRFFKAVSSEQLRQTLTFHPEQHTVLTEYQLKNNQLFRTLYVGKKDQAPCLVDRFVGAYTKPELIKYLAILSQNFRDKSAMILCSANHAVNLNYDPVAACWYFVNAHTSKQFSRDDLENLSEHIIDGFSVNVIGIKKDTAVFFTEILVNSNKKERTLNDLVAMQKSPDWISLHTITEQKARLTDNNLYGLISVASHQGYLKIVEELIHSETEINGCKEAKMTPLHLASLQGHAAIVTCLINNGAIVDFNTSGDNRTALHLASRWGHVAVVSALIKFGANVDAIDIDGKTPLYLALEENHQDIARILLDNGATINLSSKDNDTLLHVACSLRDQSHVVEALVKHGANIHAINSNSGKTPLYIASETGKLDVVVILVQSGAYIDAPDTSSLTPLHAACLWYHIPVVEFLLKNGANIDAADKRGRTALHFAAKPINKSLIELLIKMGADPTHRDNKGLTAYDLAMTDRFCDQACLDLLNPAVNLNMTI